LGVGQNDNLAGIGRVGEDFLVSGESGIEDNFPAPLCGRTKTPALEDVPVFQGEDCSVQLRLFLPGVDNLHFSIADRGITVAPALRPKWDKFVPPRRVRLLKNRRLSEKSGQNLARLPELPYLIAKIARHIGVSSPEILHVSDNRGETFFKLT
jgi:hypothetical protein